MGLRAQQQKQKTTEDPLPMPSSGSTDAYTDANSHPAQSLDDTPSRNIVNVCTTTRVHTSESSGLASDMPLSNSASSEKTIVIHQCTVFLPFC